MGHLDVVYFDAGKIADDQLHDLAQRRGENPQEMERLLTPNL